jgi:hypothetical protein
MPHMFSVFLLRLPSTPDHNQVNLPPRLTSQTHETNCLNPIRQNRFSFLFCLSTYHHIRSWSMAGHAKEEADIYIVYIIILYYIFLLWLVSTYHHIGSWSMAGHAKEEADIYSIYYIIHIVYHILLFCFASTYHDIRSWSMAGHAKEEANIYIYV